MAPSPEYLLQPTVRPVLQVKPRTVETSPVHSQRKRDDTISQKNPFDHGNRQQPASEQAQTSGSSSAQQSPELDISGLTNGMSGLGVTTAQTMDDEIIGIKEQLSNIRAQILSDERMHIKKEQAKRICRSVAEKEVQGQNAHVMQSIDEIRARIDGLADIVSGLMNTAPAGASSRSQENSGHNQ